jgi:hypothetical protein
MQTDNATIEWLLNSDPALRWQVERDLLGLPESTWMKTRELTGTEGFGARLLGLQDDDGQWAGGAYFPGRTDERALQPQGDAKSQPFIATTWSLNSLREWGVSALHLGDTAAKLHAGCKWEYEDLPYWQGEVDCCINGFTIANGAWLNVDVSFLATWFVEHQLQDGGWNCDWVEGAKRSSFHSTLNALIGILEYEKLHAPDEKLREARRRGEEYLLKRHLLRRLSDNSEVGEWVGEFSYPARWRYSALRAMDYFRQARQFDGLPADNRMSEAVARIIDARQPNGRWLNQKIERGSVWFEVDGAEGEESKWVTLTALLVLKWWQNARLATIV